MQLNSQNLSNKITQNQPNFGLLDMSPRKIAKTFYPKDSAAAQKLLKEAEIAKTILQTQTKKVHAIVIPARNYDGTPRIDIGIQELTPKSPRSWNPIKNLLNWASRKLEIKYKEPRTVGYIDFYDLSEFIEKLMNKTDELKRKFYKKHKLRIRPAKQLIN